MWLAKLFALAGDIEINPEPNQDWICDICNNIINNGHVTNTPVQQQQQHNPLHILITTTNNKFLQPRNSNIHLKHNKKTNLFQ